MLHMLTYKTQMYKIRRAWYKKQIGMISGRGLKNKSIYEGCVCLQVRLWLLVLVELLLT